MNETERVSTSGSRFCFVRVWPESLKAYRLGPARVRGCRRVLTAMTWL